MTDRQTDRQIERRAISGGVIYLLNKSKDRAVITGTKSYLPTGRQAERHIYMNYTHHLSVIGIGGKNVIVTIQVPLINTFMCLFSLSLPLSLPFLHTGSSPPPLGVSIVGYEPRTLWI